MRRIALISAILGVLIVGDGIYQLIANYNSGETQDLLHLGKVMLPDGLTLILSGAVVLIVALIAFLLPARSPQQKA
jgi:hypothetical protein